MTRLLAALGQLLANLSQLKNLTWVQWVILGGSAAAAFGTTYTATHDWREAAAGAIAAGAIYLQGLASPPPIGKHAAPQNQDLFGVGDHK